MLDHVLRVAEAYKYLAANLAGFEAMTPHQQEVCVFYLVGPWRP